MARADRAILWFSEIDKDDIPLVGGKGANLGEIARAGFPVPDGFVITAQAYFAFLRENNLMTKIRHLLTTVHFERSESLLQVSSHIKKEIIQGTVSEKLTEELFSAYEKLGGVFQNALVAVRSSATAEDLPTASFAGQQETYLNVKGEANLLLKLKEAWASLFEARAIFYRHDKHFDHFRVGIAIVVQKMVASDTSGVMFTIDPVTNEKSKIVIEAIYGLGEMIVQGRVTPDHYEVAKSDFFIRQKAIEKQTLLLKKVDTKNKEMRVASIRASRQKITDSQIKNLARLGKQIEHHYYFPQDIEWAIEKGKIYIVQTRPITTTEKKNEDEEGTKRLASLKLILKGAPASPGIASGPVTILRSLKDLNDVKTGDVLVALQTNPDYVPAMRRAVAIVTERGGRTSHAAIVSRELGIPAVVGAQKATVLLHSGAVVTVDGLHGEVYRGGSPTSYSTLPEYGRKSVGIKTVTKMYVNLAQPEIADKIAQLNVDGVGLLRAEFMMANIGTHPKKLIHDGKKHIFIDKLAEQLEVFCKAFDPRPVVYRTSDFKTNEYRGLVGGAAYEPVEPNPMLGYRGAFRYINDPQIFLLELEAIKRVRNERGLQNLWVMIPFVRTVSELSQVKKIVTNAGLHRSSTFRLWMMVEIPSNVVLLDQFIACGIDGISIGSNDLTMLMLGTDRDNSEVASAFSELNDAALWAFEHTIKTATKHKVTASICGQAPSLYPILLEKLIEWGITSVSIAPDTIDTTRLAIAEFEKKLMNGGRSHGKN